MKISSIFYLLLASILSEQMWPFFILSSKSLIKLFCWLFVMQFCPEWTQIKSRNFSHRFWCLSVELMWDVLCFQCWLQFGVSLVLQVRLWWCGVENIKFNFYNKINTKKVSSSALRYVHCFSSANITKVEKVQIHSIGVSTCCESCC